MANRMQPLDANMAGFIATIEDASKRSDASRLIELMTVASGEPPTMWGASIVGFGRYHYRYESGREGDSPAVSFSPRAQTFTLYLTGGFDEIPSLLDRLGPYRRGKGCLHIKRLDDVDENALAEILEHSLAKAAEFDTSSSR